VQNIKCSSSQVSLKQLQQETGAQPLTNSYYYTATWPQ